MKEIWIGIKNFENYQVSNFGKVRSLGYYNGKNGFVKGNILKYCDNERYARITLFRDKKRYKVSIHRLVAENFIENTHNKKCVNHIDGNTKNNCVNNLEWATYQENTQHAYKTGLMDKTIKATIKRNNKKVINVKTGQIFESATYVANLLNINRITFCNYLNGWTKNKTDFKYVTD